MTVALSSMNGDLKPIELSIFAWDKLLEIARRHGWQPAGTVFDEAALTVYGDPFPGLGPEERAKALAKELAEMNSRWEGAYDGSEFQVVTAADAGEFAAALRRAADRLEAASVTDITGTEHAISLRKVADFFAAGPVRIW